MGSGSLGFRYRVAINRAKSSSLDPYFCLSSIGIGLVDKSWQTLEMECHISQHL